MFFKKNNNLIFSLICFLYICLYFLLHHSGAITKLDSTVFIQLISDYAEKGFYPKWTVSAFLNPYILLYKFTSSKFILHLFAIMLYVAHLYVLSRILRGLKFSYYKINIFLMVWAFHPASLIYNSVLMSESTQLLSTSLAAWAYIGYIKKPCVNKLIYALGSSVLLTFSHTGFAFIAFAISWVILFISAFMIAPYRNRVFVYSCILVLFSFFLTLQDEGCCQIYARVFNQATVVLNKNFALNLPDLNSFFIKKLNLSSDVFINGEGQKSFSDIYTSRSSARTDYFFRKENNQISQVPSVRYALYLLGYLFGPFFFEVSSYKDLLAYLISLVRLLSIFTCFVFWGRVNVKQNIKRFLALYYLVIVMAFAIATGNYGASFRHNLITDWIILLFLFSFSIEKNCLIYRWCEYQLKQCFFMIRAFFIREKLPGKYVFSGTFVEMGNQLALEFGLESFILNSKKNAQNFSDLDKIIECYQKYFREYYDLLCGMSLSSEKIGLRDVFYHQFYCLHEANKNTACSSMYVVEKNYLGQVLDLGINGTTYPIVLKPQPGHAIFLHFNMPYAWFSFGVNNQGLFLSGSSVTVNNVSPESMHGLHMPILPFILLNRFSKIEDAAKFIAEIQYADKNLGANWLLGCSLDKQFKRIELNPKNICFYEDEPITTNYFRSSANQIYNISIEDPLVSNSVERFNEGLYFLSSGEISKHTFSDFLKSYLRLGSWRRMGLGSDSGYTAATYFVDFNQGKVIYDLGFPHHKKLRYSLNLEECFND